MILLIDTSQETGTVALSKEGKVLFSEENKIAKEHAVWLHTAVKRIIAEAKITPAGIRELEAIAVIAGPGSYQDSVWEWLPRRDSAMRLKSR